jgi:hypothetical protein
MRAQVPLLRALLQLPVVFAPPTFAKTFRVILVQLEVVMSVMLGLRVYKTYRRSAGLLDLVAYLVALATGLSLLYFRRALVMAPV